MARMRAAIVGAGLMGCWHATYAARRDAEIVAIVDPDRSRALHLQRRFRQAHCYGTLEECLDCVPVDVVHICTPADPHFELAACALRSRRHVLVEKPVAERAEQARQLVQLAREGDRQFCCVHQFPFQYGVRKLQRQLGRIGELIRIEYRIHSAGGDGLGSESRRRILLEMLPHAVSLIRRLIDFPLPGWKWSVHRFSADDLDCTAVREGVLLDLRFSMAARPALNWLSVMGTRGSLHADLFHGYSYLEPGRVSRSEKLLRPFRQAARQSIVAAVNLTRRSLRRQAAYPGLPELIRSFYASIRDGGPSPVTAGEMMESVALIETVRDAAVPRQQITHAA